MPRLLPILFLSMILGINARPNCVYDEFTFRTTCTAGDTPHILNRGLVSDNNETTYISLQACKIAGVSLEAFQGLPRLKTLDISDNQIPMLKLGVLDGATQVTHLNLSYNQLEFLPLGLFNQTKRIEYLNLKANKLSNFALGLFDPLSRLGFLDLSGNSFLGRELSPFLFDKCKDITFMDFSGSDMTFTHDDLLQAFRRIGFLNLSGCSLVEVPKFATRTNLGTMNHLMLIDDVITKIDDPNTFNNLINLEQLNFAGNPIESVHADVFKQLKKLKNVVIAGTQLKEIPDSLFRDLNKLTDVDLSHNLLECIPVDAFRGTALNNLKLNNNRFTYLADNFVLELSNSGAKLMNMQLDENPWQCACLRDIMNEMKSKNVKYNTEKFDGKHKVCVTKEFACKRQPSDNEIFVDLYFNSV